MSDIHELPDGLGLDRDELPQIASDDLDEFKSFLDDHGVFYRDVNKDVGTLKPSQGHLNLDKIRAIRDELEAGEPETKGMIIVSSDGYVLDGHHRWAAIYHAQGVSNDTLVLEVDLPIEELIRLGHEFDGSFVKSVHDSRHLINQVLEGKTPDSVVAGALYDFAARLTTEEPSFMIGHDQDATVALDSLIRWADERGLSLDNPDIEHWADEIVKQSVKEHDRRSGEFTFQDYDQGKRPAA